MPRWFTAGWVGLQVMLLMPRVTAAQVPGHASPAGDNVRVIPRTKLKVAIPKNWQLANPPLGAWDPQLKHTDNPQYTIMVAQSSVATSEAASHSCMELMGAMEAMEEIQAKSPLSHLLPRPAYLPDVYFGSIINVSTAQLTCLNTGDGEVSLIINLARGDSNPEVLTPMLASIAEAALKQSSAVSGPGTLKLPLLGIEIPVRHDSWGVQSGTYPSRGKIDVLGRVSKPSSNELTVAPFVLKLKSDHCWEGLMNTDVSGHLVTGRKYGDAQWDPDALEQVVPPLGSLEALACRNLGNNRFLLAQIRYEKTEISDADRPVLRQLLDDIGDAVDRKPLAAQPPPPPKDASLPFATTPQQSQRPFTLEQVKTMVRDGLMNDRGASAIAAQGIDFTPTDDLLRILQAAGSSDVFLRALRTASSGPAPIGDVQPFR